MREKFHTHRGVHGWDVASICDPSLRFVTQVLACKFLRKFQKYPPKAIIEEAKKCVEGVQMNWVTFLLN
jgi:hypothetical protein